MVLAPAFKRFRTATHEKGRHLDDAPVGRIALVRGRAHRDTARVSHPLLVRKQNDLRRDVPMNCSSASCLLRIKRIDPEGTVHPPSASIGNASSLRCGGLGRGRLQLTPEGALSILIYLCEVLARFFGALPIHDPCGAIGSASATLRTSR